MTNHTPTTEEVEKVFTGEEPKWGGTVTWRRAMFYRWLTAHDRKIAAEALRGAANDMHRSWCQEDGPSDWLDIRADRIEQGGDE